MDIIETQLRFFSGDDPDSFPDSGTNYHIDYFWIVFFDIDVQIEHNVISIDSASAAPEAGNAVSSTAAGSQSIGRSVRFPGVRKQQIAALAQRRSVGLPHGPQL